MASKGPNDKAPVKAPIKLQFLHTDNATLLMSDSYRAKILAEKVIHNSLWANFTWKQLSLVFTTNTTQNNNMNILYNADLT